MNNPELYREQTACMRIENELNVYTKIERYACICYMFVFFVFVFLSTSSKRENLPRFITCEYSNIRYAC